MAPRTVVSAVILGLFLGWSGIQDAASQDGTEALGTPVGTFLIYPAVTLDTEYNDNIFATNTNEEDDVIFTVSPEVSVQSDWANHALEFLGSASFLQHVEHTSENARDYRFVGSGRLDILRDTAATANAGISRDHEERGSPNDVNGQEPTVSTTYAGNLGFQHRFNLLWVELDGGVSYIDFKDADAVGGPNINNDDRDRFEYSSRARVGYDFNPDVAAFVQTTFNLTDYDDRTDDNGFDRNSYEYGAAAGMRLDFTDLLFGDAFFGYQRSEFDDSQFDPRNTYEVGGNLTWLVTALTTANFFASRLFEETTVAGASTALTTTAGASVSHSLLDTVNLGASFTYTREAFEDISRRDQTIETGPSVTYLMNRFVHWNLSYTYTRRFSSAAAQDYVENSVLLSMRLQY